MHPNPDLYVQDFYTWCLEQATLLEARDADALDWEHLAEEMMILAGSERRALPMPPTDFGKRFRQFLTQAGVPAIRRHDTRHTFATLMLELGASPRTVQTMLGHTSVPITLDFYSHVSLELETRAAARLGDVLMGEK